MQLELSATFENPVQCCDAFFILLHRSDGNADPFRQVVALKRAHDNFLREQFLKDNCSVADIHHDEICRARYELEFHFTKLLLQVVAACVDNLLRFALMRLVRERGEGPDLRDLVNVEWLPRFLEYLDQFAPGNSVADAQTGEAVNFRKRAQDDDVPTVANVLKCVGRILEKLEISFVEHGNDVFRQARDELVDLYLRDQRPGRVVWIGDENYSRFGRDRLEHRLEIVLIIRAGRFNRVRAEEGRDQFVGDEGVLGDDHLIAGIYKRVAEKLDHFVRAVPENDIFARETEPGTERAAQIKTAAVWIKPSVFQLG